MRAPKVESADFSRLASVLFPQRAACAGSVGERSSRREAAGENGR